MVPKEKLVYMIRRTHCTEACMKRVPPHEFKPQWIKYTKNVGHVNGKHDSLYVWCFQCGGMACRQCIDYFEGYKIIPTDWYHCNNCRSGLAIAAGITIITLKQIPKYLQYVLILLQYCNNIVTILLQYCNSTNVLPSSIYNSINIVTILSQCFNNVTICYQPKGMHLMEDV